MIYSLTTKASGVDRSHGIDRGPGAFISLILV